MDLSIQNKSIDFKCIRSKFNVTEPRHPVKITNMKPYFVKIKITNMKPGRQERGRREEDSVPDNHALDALIARFGI